MMPQLASYWLAVSFSCDVMMMSLARKFGPRPWKDDTASDGREVYRVEPPTIVKVGARLGPFNISSFNISSNSYDQIGPTQSVSNDQKERIAMGPGQQLYKTYNRRPRQQILWCSG